MYIDCTFGAGQLNPPAAALLHAMYRCRHLQISMLFSIATSTSLSAICLCLSLQCWHSQSSELSCSDDKFASGQLCSSLAQPVPVHTGPTSPWARTLLQQKHLHFTIFSIWNEVLPLSCAHTPALESVRCEYLPSTRFFRESSAERDSVAKSVGGSIII